MTSKMVVFERIPHVVLRRGDEWGLPVLDLASPPRRLWGSQSTIPASFRTQIDPNQTEPYPTPGQLLTSPLPENDTLSAMSKRSLARFEAFFLTAEDPQRRLDARDVVTLAHQVSLVRHILDTPGRQRILIGDEVGLGKTVVAGLIIKELLETNPGLRVLYLAPARLVSNVGREFKRLSLFFREWKSLNGDARLDTDRRIIASIHRAIHPNHFGNLLRLPPWDIIVVDECHHLTDWGEGGGDPVMKYRLVRDLVNAQSAESRLLLLSGTPHQAHAARFENLLRLLSIPGEPESAAAGKVIYRTKEDVRDWDGNPLFPRRQVNPPIVVDLDPDHKSWLTAIHEFFSPSEILENQARQRAAGWKCAQALQWAASSPNAGLGYLVRQALRSGWTLDRAPLSDAIAALRPYRSGPANESVDSLYHRLITEIGRQRDDDDIEDIEEGIFEEDELNHIALAALISQGIQLVRSSRQQKWERLFSEVIQPAGMEKIVLFAQPIETVTALSTWLEKKTGRRPAIIIGGQSDAVREQQVALFKSSSGPQFLISSRAGGEGINLQFSRRLVHLDVPWNPMEMEQRVGRVHRFGSRETILVDTIVVRDSRETEAWRVARERLTAVAQTLVAPDRFESVFSRVMCLIPPEELQTVIISSPTSPLADTEVQKLSSLIDSGFRDWQQFHDRYADNQNQIRRQPSGLSRWSHLRELLTRYGNATKVDGIEQTKFLQREGQVHTVEDSAEVLKLSDGSLCFVGDFEGALFTESSSKTVGPLGLNIPAVADLLRNLSSPSLPTGGAHLRWGELQKDLRDRLGAEVVILGFVRQAFRVDSIGGATESGTELFTYMLTETESRALSPQEKEELFDMSQLATVRVKPSESSLLSRVLSEENRIIDELRRPSDDEIRNGVRYAVWPILALHIS